MVRRMVAGLVLAAVAVPALSACNGGSVAASGDALACHDVTARTTVREAFSSQGANDATLRIYDAAWSQRHCPHGDALALPR